MRPGGEILFVPFRDAPPAPHRLRFPDRVMDTEFQRHARHSQSHYSGRYIHMVFPHSGG